MGYPGRRRPGKRKGGRGREQGRARQGEERLLSLCFVIFSMKYEPGSKENK